MGGFFTISTTIKTRWLSGTRWMGKTPLLLCFYFTYLFFGTQNKRPPILLVAIGHAFGHNLQFGRNHLNLEFFYEVGPKTSYKYCYNSTTYRCDISPVKPPCASQHPQLSVVFFKTHPSNKEVDGNNRADLSEVCSYEVGPGKHFMNLGLILYMSN